MNIFDLEPSRYTFPPTAFAYDNDHRIGLEVEVFQDSDYLAVIADLDEPTLFQIVHKPSGLFVLKGTKTQMCREFRNILKIQGIPWKTIHQIPDRRLQDYPDLQAIRKRYT